MPVQADRRAARGQPDRACPVVLGALFLGLVAILFVALEHRSIATTKQGRVRRRLSLYTLTGRPQPEQEQTTTALGSSQVARSAVELAGRVVQRRDFEAALGLRLEAAGVPLRAAEWMLIHVGVAIGRRAPAAPRPAAASLPTRCSAWSSAWLLPWALPHRQGVAAHVGLPRAAAGHPAAGRRQPVGRLLHAAGDGHRRPGGPAADHRRVQPRAGRGAARRPDRGRAGRRRRADEEQGLRLGRDGHPDPARGRRQPRRAADHGGGDPARARAAAPPGAGALGRGPAVGVDPRPAARSCSPSTCCWSGPTTSSRWSPTRSAGCCSASAPSCWSSAPLWMRKAVKVEV